MTGAARIDCEMNRVMPASLAHIEEFFEEFRRKSRNLPGVKSCFAAELLLREALTNAVVHGCRSDLHKRVHCWLRLKGRKLLILVKDEGQGFDWRGAWNRSAILTDCSGRGVEILRKYARQVRFNDKGNAVAIITHLS